ncbi:MAG: transcriptional repressor [Acidimicrobiales bacterium]|nr:transcriptional repressor [Acidimicrobiales bacterium]
MKTPAELTELFRSRGLKITPQRVSIFRALYDNDTHPTAEAVYAKVLEEMPTISLRTVYQTLNDLAAMGEITQLDLGTGSARFDPNLSPHHHLVCESCGQVRDVYGEFDGVKIPKNKLAGFQVSSTEIVFRGLCPDCAAAAEYAGAGAAT